MGNSEFGISGKAAFVRVSPRDPRYLELSDGRPYIPIGLNMTAPRRPDARVETDGAAGMATMERWMRALAANGGNYIRVWLARGIWNVEHERCGVYDEERARRIDAMLALARTLGIRVKMTLEYFREVAGSVAPTTWTVAPGEMDTPLNVWPLNTTAGAVVPRFWPVTRM